MKSLLVNFTDEQAKGLSKYPNMSEAVRNAVDIYNEHITTDMLTGLRVSYKELRSFMESKFEYYDKVFGDLEKLIDMLETRL